MLLDRGPIDPIDVDAWTRPGDRIALAPDAVALVAQLDAGVGAIARAQATMAGSAQAAMETAAANDLDDAAAAHAGQAQDFDDSIGAVAGNTDAMNGEIPGLSSDAASDVVASTAVDFGRYVPHPADDKGPPPPIGEAPEPTPPPATPPPGGTVADWIDQQYQRYLRRHADTDGINSWTAFWPNEARIIAGIVASDEYAGQVDNLYQAFFGRGVQTQELADARAQQWTLDQVEADLRRRA